MYEVGKPKLADLLRKADMTQAELSELTGIPKSSISGYVKGDHIMSLVSAYRISRVLKCNIENLYNWKRVSRR